MSHKYGAKPTTVDSIRFDSQAEARRYRELKLLEKAGQINSLCLQPVYELRAPNDHDQWGSEQKIGEYRADFSYQECNHGNGHRGWRTIVEDVKGFKTPLYRWKKKHVEAQYGITIREVTARRR
jgi:hypothetical protein